MRVGTYRECERKCMLAVYICSSITFLCVNTFRALFHLSQLKLMKNAIFLYFFLLNLVTNELNHELFYIQYPIPPFVHKYGGLELGMLTLVQNSSWWPARKSFLTGNCILWEEMSNKTT